MFRSVLMAVCLLASAPVWAEPPAPLPAAAMNDKVAAYLEASVKLEVDTLTDFTNALRKTIEKKGVAVPNDVKAAHQFGSKSYDDAKKAAEEKNYVEAYRMLRDAWLINRTATAWFVDNADGETLKGIGTKLHQTLSQRITDLEPQLKNAPEEAKKQFAQAKTLHASAQASLQAGDAKKSLLTAIDAIRALDDSLHTTWKAAV